MPSILALFFSLLTLMSCGKHSQVADGKQGVANTLQVASDALSEDILQENIERLTKYASRGGDLETELANGRTLLTEACHWAKFKVIAFLVSRKVDLGKRDRAGKSGLDYGNQDMAIKRALFPELVIELKRRLFLAARRNALTDLKKIMEEGPPVNFFLEQAELGDEMAGLEGETFLTFLVVRKLENVLRLLAQPKYELDVKLTNKRGETALQLSRQLKFTSIEKLLLKLGATE